MKKIMINISGGCVHEVQGVPEGYELDIRDYDYVEDEEGDSEIDNVYTDSGGRKYYRFSVRGNQG